MSLPCSCAVKAAVFLMDFCSDDSTRCPFAFESESLPRWDVGKGKKNKNGESRVQGFSATFLIRIPCSRLGLHVAVHVSIAHYRALINLITAQHAGSKRRRCGRADNLDRRPLDVARPCFPLFEVLLLVPPPTALSRSFMHRHMSHLAPPAQTNTLIGSCIGFP